MTREEAIEHLKEWREVISSGHRKAVIDMAIEALTNWQNMHKGEWIKKQVFNPELDMYVPLIECSVCGYEPYYGGSESKFNYCPNCGAEIKKGEK